MPWKQCACSRFAFHFLGACLLPGHQRGERTARRRLAQGSSPLCDDVHKILAIRGDIVISPRNYWIGCQVSLSKQEERVHVCFQISEYRKAAKGGEVSISIVARCRRSRW